MEIEQETVVRPKATKPPPRIIIMPPIPSRTEIAATWLGETVNKYAWWLLGSVALLAGIGLGLIAISVLHK